jgi:hypothetical protein
MATGNRTNKERGPGFGLVVGVGLGLLVGLLLKKIALGLLLGIAVAWILYTADKR